MTGTKKETSLMLKKDYHPMTIRYTQLFPGKPFLALKMRRWDREDEQSPELVIEDGVASRLRD